jgi:osmotically inducible protein OsmC
MQLDVVAVVPNIDDAAFQKAAQSAKENCPVSRALNGNVDVKLNAKLQSA